MGWIKSFFAGVLIALGIVITLNLLARIGLFGIGGYVKTIGTNIGSVFSNLGNFSNISLT